MIYILAFIVVLYNKDVRLFSYWSSGKEFWSKIKEVGSPKREALIGKI